MASQGKKAPKARLNEAKKLFMGDLEAAAKVFLQLAIEFPADMEIRFSYASALFRLRRFAEAVPQFDILVQDQPTNEWASLGLFHSLWQVERGQEAIDEILVLVAGAAVGVVVLAAAATVAVIHAVKMQTDPEYRQSVIDGAQSTGDMVMGAASAILVHFLSEKRVGDAGDSKAIKMRKIKLLALQKSRQEY